MTALAAVPHQEERLHIMNPYLLIEQTRLRQRELHSQPVFHESSRARTRPKRLRMNIRLGAMLVTAGLWMQSK